MNELIKTLVEHPDGTFCLGVMVIWWTVMAAYGAKKAGLAFGTFFHAFFDSLLDMGWAKERTELAEKLAQTEKDRDFFDKERAKLADELEIVRGKLGKARGMLHHVLNWHKESPAELRIQEVEEILAETAHTLNADLTCDFDPSDVKGPLGMFHCPQCGEMVMAGQPHPDYTILDKET